MRYEAERSRRVHGKYPRERTRQGSIEPLLGMHEGLFFSSSFSHLLLGTPQHSWQGGVLERIERHLAFLWRQLALPPGSFFFF
jgi:hypothetical protein